MTRDETKRIVRVLASSYSNFHETSELIDCWTLILEDVQFELMQMATIAYIRTDTKGFAPSPGQLLDQIQKIKSVNEMTEMEAWSKVQRAICDSTYHSKERFSELPESCQKAVGSPDVLKEWGQTDMETLGTVIQSNFLRAYRTIQQRKADIEKMPHDVQALIQNTIQGMIQG